MLTDIILVLIGFAVGTFGTLVGAGGGFILMPVLLLMFPEQSPEILTSISLAVVFFNAASGSLAYSRMKKIDYRSGLIFSLAAVPGAIVGSYIVKYINRNIFNVIFGILLFFVSVYLYFRAGVSSSAGKEYPPHYSKRFLVDSEDNEYAYAFEHKTGIIISILVGFISSLSGYWRRNYPRACNGKFTEFSGSYCDCYIPFHTGYNGFSWDYHSYNRRFIYHG